MFLWFLNNASCPVLIAANVAWSGSATHNSLSLSSNNRLFNPVIKEDFMMIFALADLALFDAWTVFTKSSNSVSEVLKRSLNVPIKSVTSFLARATVRSNGSWKNRAALFIFVWIEKYFKRYSISDYHPKGMHAWLLPLKASAGVDRSHSWSDLAYIYGRSLDTSGSTREVLSSTWRGKLWEVISHISILWTRNYFAYWRPYWAEAEAACKVCVCSLQGHFFVQSVNWRPCTFRPVYLLTYR